MKSFNITGTCRPNEHYMVDITERLEIIRGMVSTVVIGGRTLIEAIV